MNGPLPPDGPVTWDAMRQCWIDRHGPLTPEGYSRGPSAAYLVHVAREQNRHYLAALSQILIGLVFGGLAIAFLVPWIGLAFMGIMFFLAWLWVRHPTAAKVVGYAGAAYVGYKVFQHHENADQ